jgi:DNA-binding NarL/FixJ family response regulator
LSNREVADQLVLSTKTIEFHLSQIFRKLDITTRRQIAKHLLLTEGT